MLHPLAELGVGVGGMMIPPAGWRSATAVPVLCPEFQSVLSTKVRAVGETSLNVGALLYA